ncbi:hypothetical protein M231_00322 [Tremella mesenterica]|uniref:Uncharacterized protein n=1 Tax=Tremella mesenterica TaxID=5217 RepID=A0A4Q1BW85_TREME|nr:hypothetical protein M231_00322 [Tremella mesenterica]
MICDCVGSCQFESQARSGSTEALYKRLLCQSTQGDIRSDFDEMVWLKHSVRKALSENSFGRCGERWTGNVLKYRMREGGQRLAAAIALLPNINPLPYSLRTLLECEIFSQSSYRLTRGCETDLNWPFKDEYEHTSPTEDSWRLASVWACWAQTYAKWLCGDENVWDSWEFEHLAPRPVIYYPNTHTSNTPIVPQERSESFYTSPSNQSSQPRPSFPLLIPPTYSLPQIYGITSMPTANPPAYTTRSFNVFPYPPNLPSLANHQTSTSAPSAQMAYYSRPTPYTPVPIYYRFS